MVKIIKWFVESYDPAKYVCKIRYFSGHCILSIEDDCGEMFVYYTWKKGKAINSPCDTDGCQKYLKSKGLFDEQKTLCYL